MRVPKAVQEQVRLLIEPHDTPQRRHRYMVGDFPRSDAVRDLDRRYRWDLFWATGASVPVMAWALDAGVAQDAKDAWIDTMLRRIVPTLGQEERVS